MKGKYNKMHNKLIKAFSLTELMIIMVLVSISLAASIPVVTKKHLQLPTMTEHGSYICYYDETGQLHEKRYANKFGVNQPVLDQVTDHCIFNPPRKASYFQISAVGGGGGGGDSGYTGGNLHSGWIPLMYISPFNISETDLENRNMSYADFKTYAGILYAYARGTNSGAGGNTNYVTHENPCISGHDEYNKNEYGTLVGGQVAIGEGDEICTYSYTYLDCSTKTVTENVPYTVTDPNSCRDVVSTQEICPNLIDKINHVVEYCCKDTVTNIENCSTSPSNRDACVAGNNSRFIPTKKEYDITTKVCDGDYTTLTSTTRQCDTITKYKTVTYEKFTCEEKTATHTSTGSSCVGATDSDVHDLGIISYTQTYVCDEANDYFKWNDGGLGGRARIGARCASSGVAGDVNLSYTEESNALSDGNSGISLNSSGNAEGYPTSNTNSYGGDGTAYCADGVFRNVCSNPSYSIFKIQQIVDNALTDKATAKAFSASRGGLGAYRTIGGEGEIYYNNPTSRDSNNNGDGTCENGTSVDESWCQNIGNHNKTGYCLKHANGTMQPNGSYTYRYSFDENYLQFGNPGEAGEYKIMVVRSFKDIDTAIHIGRGGAAGTPHSGAAGASGSATYMGSLIYANGGEGGKGGLVTQNEVLPGYNATKYNNGEFVKQTGQLSSSAPALKGLASNLFSYVLPKVQNVLDAVFNKAGYGGKGGGVTHNCWAGQAIVEFEGHILTKSSVYPGNTYITPSLTVVNTPNSGQRVPSSCYNNFSVDDATDGTDGALMIKW